MRATAAVERLREPVTRWPAGSRLRAGSLSGISLACGICAALWFTAGTVPGTLAGTAALAACWLAQAGAHRSAGADAAAGAARGPAAGADAAAAGAVDAVAGPGGAADAGAGRARPVDGRAVDGWLAAGCGTAAELAAYGGLAAGAPSWQQGRVWPLATAALILLAFRQMAGLCQERPGPVPGPAVARRLGRVGWRLGTVPFGVRVVLIGVTALAWSPQLTFTALLAGGGIAVILLLARPAAARPAPGLPGCRGDGPLARRAGWLVRGQLTPLPPVVAGLAATILLAVVGLHGLSGVVTLAPAAAMMLAAPGAGHPHNGRLDWLVPPALQAGQYIYLTALGFAAGVPGPLTFTLVCVIALRHLDVAYRARHRLAWRPRYAGAGLGWEGRMLAAGIAALLGVATFAYLVLTAYLGVLLGWICLSSWYSAQEGVRE